MAFEYSYGIVDTKSTRGGNSVPVILADSLISFSIAIGASSATAAGDTGCPYRSENAVLRFRPVGADCRIAVGSAPTATATSAYCAADEWDYFGVKFGQKPAVIQD